MNDEVTNNKSLNYLVVVTGKYESYRQALVMVSDQSKKSIMVNVKYREKILAHVNIGDILLLKKVKAVYEEEQGGWQYSLWHESIISKFDNLVEPYPEECKYQINFIYFLPTAFIIVFVPNLKICLSFL